MEWLAQHWLDIINIITYVIAGASVIVQLTPTPNDDAFLAKVIKVIAAIGLNKTNLTK